MTPRNAVLIALACSLATGVIASLPDPLEDDTLTFQRHEQPYYGRVWRDPEGYCFIDTGCSAIAYACDENHVFNLRVLRERRK